MGLDSRPSQIVALTVIVGAIVGFLWLTGAWGQTRLKDVPVVSDRVVAKTDTIRIVDRDEHQRIVDKLVTRIQILENRVTELESEISGLRSDLEDEIEGG